jgi:hypothetical protein
MRRLGLALFMVGLGAVPAWAVCGGTSPNLVPADLSLPDVQDCVDKAVDGDTITLPA